MRYEYITKIEIKFDKKKTFKRKSIKYLQNFIFQESVKLPQLIRHFKETCNEFVLEEGFEAKLSDQVLLDYVNGLVSTEEMREHVKVEEQKWIRKAKKFALYDDLPYRMK